MFQKTPERPKRSSSNTTSRQDNSNVNNSNNSNNQTGQANGTISTMPPLKMMPEEQAMVNEINLLRTEPQGYIQYVKEYMQAIRMNPDLSENFKQTEIAAARELVSEMIRMTPIRSLKAHQGLYQAAKKHGDDVKLQGELDHVGTDGSFPWDRISNIAQLKEGNENLVGGGKSVREAVIILLVDSGVSGRGHRLALLNPNWEYVACHKIGTVGSLENSWIQVFGKDGKAAPMAGNTGSYAASGNQPGKSTPPTSYNNQNRNNNTGNNSNQNSNTNKNTNNSASSFMSPDEMAMLKEINLMRDNPRGYVRYVRQYISDFKRAGWDQATTREEVETAEELIKELQRRLPLSTLKPHRELQEVAKRHGEDLKRIGKVQHRGSDGSQPWDRITKGTDLSDGNENLVGGGTSVRESVIMLLVDSGIPNRGHRRTLLDPRWEYAACSKAGNIGGMPESWVQVFGKK